MNKLNKTGTPIISEFLLKYLEKNYNNKISATTVNTISELRYLQGQQSIIEHLRMLFTKNTGF